MTADEESERPSLALGRHCGRHVMAPSKLRRQDINLSALATHWHSIAHNLRGDDDRLLRSRTKTRAECLWPSATSVYSGSINLHEYLESSYCPPTASRLVALSFPFLALVVLIPYNIAYGACFEQQYSLSILDHGRPI